MNINRITMSVVLIVVVVCISLSAFNHPELKWRTIATKHFLIHYYDRTEPALYAVSKVAEESYASLAKLYSYEFKDRINITITDYDDISNGFAAWTERNILIMLPDLRFELRGNTPWLRNVMNHELAHIITLEKSGGMQLLDWVFKLQYAAPHAQIAITEPWANGRFFPAWFVEGIAQYETQKHAGDCWDSRRDMILRCAVLSNTQLSLDAMGHFNHDGVGNEMVYDHGFSFVTFLSEQLGEEVVAKVFSEGRTGGLIAAGFLDFFNEQTGRSLSELHRQWLDSLRSTYKNNLPAAETLRKVVYGKGKINDQPQVSPDGRYLGFLTNDRDDASRTDLLIVNRQSGAAVTRIAYAQTSWTFARNGRSVFYVKARDPNANGSFYNDIFEYDLFDNAEKRLTHDARVYALSAMPDGKRLACISFKDGRFNLSMFAIGERLFSQKVIGTLGEPFNTISPAGDSAVVVSRVCSDGKARLFTVTFGDSVAIDTLLHGVVAHEESPQYGANGRVYFSADYDGVFNIYSVLPDGSDCRRHTTVVGGMFAPALIDSDTLVASEYTAEGFKIVSCKADSGEAYSIPGEARCTFKGLPVPSGKLVINSNPYDPRFLRPVWELQSYAAFNDYWGQLLLMADKGRLDHFYDSIGTEFGTGLSMFRSDAVGKRSVGFGVMAVALNLEAAYNKAVKEYNGLNVMDVPLSGINKNRSSVLQTTMQLAQERNPLQRGALLREVLLNDKKNMVAATAEKSRTAALSGQPPSAYPDWMVILMPSLGIQNRRTALDFNFDMVAQISLQSAPSLLVNAELGGDIGREWRVGVMSSFLPMSLVYQMPFYLMWQHSGYYNNNMYYNMSDVVQVQALCGPVHSLFDIGGGSYSYDWATMYGLSGYFGYPVTRYSSLSISTTQQWMTMGLPFKDLQSNLDSYSNTLYNSSSRLAYTFPIIRNINRGHSMYADALYGKILVNLDYEANSNSRGVFMSYQNGVVVARYDLSSTYCAPAVGVGLDFGFVKQYIFSRTLALNGLYNIFSKKTDVSLVVGF